MVTKQKWFSMGRWVKSLPVRTNNIPTLKASLWVELPDNYKVSVDEHFNKIKTAYEESKLSQYIL